jgi:hypothetical protein
VPATSRTADVVVAGWRLHPNFMLKLVVAGSGLCAFALAGGCTEPLSTREPESATADTASSDVYAAPSSILLRLDDLPTGWLDQPNQDREALPLSVAPSCDGSGSYPGLARVDVQASAAATFASIRGPFLYGTVTRTADANAFMRSLPSAFNAQVSPKGSGYTIVARSPRLRRVVDESFGVRINYSEPIQVSVEFVCARVDETLIGAATVTIGDDVDGIDLELLETLVDSMIGRL